MVMQQGVNKQHRVGFTVLEMMVVMSIIVTIVSIAVPFYASALVASKGKCTAFQLTHNSLL